MFFAQFEIKTILYQLLLTHRWNVPEEYRIHQDYTSLPIPRDRLPINLQRL